MVRRNGEVLERDNSNRSKKNDLCYKCGEAGNFMKNCSLLKQEFSKNFKRKRSAEYDSTFTLMAQSDDDNKEDRDSLTLALAKSKQTRDDLVTVVTDHRKTIEIFRKEKNYLLAKITDLRETIVKPEIKSKPENSGKGKERASEEHIRLEKELKATRTRIRGEVEKNRKLQAELKKGTVGGSGLKWIMDSRCSKHMTENTMDFLSLKALQGYGKKGYILGMGKKAKLIKIRRLGIKDLGDTSFSLLEILMKKDLVQRLSNSKFEEHDQLGNFDAKSDEGILLGYYPQSKAHKVYNNMEISGASNGKVDLMSKMKETCERQCNILFYFSRGTWYFNYYL
uniref:CCHC-type domain-containing protein n=1 Tax=Nicotiana tabacum TaxID=4097 RepID=A0A1S4DH05_TOBAC|nr:PREDICTED: uncharacterized protein LOC107829696 [Nicotiana tabacum]